MARTIESGFRRSEFAVLRVALVLLAGLAVHASAANSTSLATNVPEASGYTLVYQVDINNPANRNFGGGNHPYNVDNSASVATGSFSRVGYYLELTSGATTQWIYVSFDAGPFQTNASKLGVPNTLSGEFYHYDANALAANTQNAGQVTNMNVLSNVAGIVTGTNIATGNVEFWPSNYGGQNDYGVPNNPNGGSYDFGDGGASTGQGYGSMQIHNYGASQVLFAFNNWNGGGGDLGIGNRPSGGDPDWTFANNLGSYTVSTLQIVVNDAPAITSVSPVGGVLAGGTTVTVKGTSFKPGAQSIKFGANAGTSVTYVDSTTYTVVTPAGSGTVNVVMTDANGKVATLTNGYQYSNTAPPAISGFVPNNAPNMGGVTTITINGANFRTGATVTFGGTNGFSTSAPISTTFINSTTIKVLVPDANPPDASGPTQVLVTNSDSTTATASGFSYTAPAPTVVNISPSFGPYDGVTTVVISGTGFSSNFTTNTTKLGKITLGVGGPALTNINNQGFDPPSGYYKLIANVQPIAAGVNSLTNDIIVTNPDGNASAINQPQDQFTYSGSRDPENDSNLQNKVYYRYFNNTPYGATLPGYPNTTFPMNISPFSTGFTSAMNFNQSNPFQPGVGNNWAVEYAGMLNVPADGLYTFYLASDDSSVMRIGNTNVCNVNNSSATGSPIALKAGLHRFSVSYAQGGGGYYLTVQWSSPAFNGGVKENIPQGDGDIPQGDDPALHARGFYGEKPLVVTSAKPTPAGVIPDQGGVPVTVTGSGFGSYLTTLTIADANNNPIQTYNNGGFSPNFTVASATTLNGFNAPPNGYEGTASLTVSTYSGQSVTLPGGLPNGLFYDTSFKTWTWTGGSTPQNPNWSDPNNWDRGSAPDFFSYIVLTSAGMNPTNQDINGLYVTSVTYTPGTPSFVLSGFPLTFSTPPSAITIDPASPSQTINANTIFNVSTIVSTGASNKLILTGTTDGTAAPTISSGSTVQFGDGTTNSGSILANIVINGSMIIANPTAQLYSGILSGTGTLTKQLAGTLNLTGNSTFSGGTIVQAGILLISTPFGSSGVDPMGTGPVKLSGGLLRLAGQQGMSVPIPLTGSSFNFDIIAEANASYPQSGTNTAYAGWVYYEKGAPNTAQGLPAGNTPFTSQFNPLVQFQLAPYSGGANVLSKNALILASGINGDFTLATPGQFQAVQLLYNCSGSATFTAMANFSDNTHTMLTSGTSVPDWTQPGPIAITNIGLTPDNGVSPGWTSSGLYTSRLSMFEQDYTLSMADQAKTLVSITLTSNTGTPVFYALSGVPTIGGPYTATQSYTNGLTLTTNSSVDVVNSLAASMSGTFSLNGNYILHLTGDAGASLALGNGALSGSPTLDVPDATKQLSIGGFADASGVNSITKTGPGTLVVTGVCTYGGATTIASGGGTVRLGKNAVPAGSVLWLNANDTAKMTPVPPAGTATAITAWADELSAVNVTGTGTYTPNVINGQAVVHFATADAMFNLVNYPAPTSIFVVERLTGGTNGRVLSSRTNNWLLGIHGGQIDRYYYEGWVSGNGGGTQNGNAANTLPHMYEATISSTRSTASVYDSRNLANVVLRDANTFGVTGPNGIQLNGWQGAGANERSDCDIAEVLIYPSVLNATTLGQVEAYLAEKYFGTIIPGGLRGSLPTTTALTISAGTTFDVNGGTQTIGSISGPANLLAVTLGTGSLTVGGSASTTFPGTISGVGGSFGKQGSGTLTLTAANTYTGDTVVGPGSGALKVGIVNAIPSGAGKGNVVVNGNLDLNGFSIGVNALNGIGFVDNSAAGSVTLTVGNNNATGSFGGIIRNSAGAVSLTKTGSGVQSLQNASTYSGSTTIAAGTLRLITLLNNYQAYNIAAANGASNQNHPGSLGYDFTVNRTVTVTDLGFYQPTNAVYTGFSHDVKITDNTTGTTTFATGTVTTANTLSNGYRFLTLVTPVTLAPGVYRIWGSRYSDGDFNTSSVLPGPLDTGSGALTFGPPNRGYYGNTAGLFPTNQDNTSGANTTPYRYGAVSFKFSDPSVITGTGQLPVGTALTIMNGSTFDLNNINQTIGSLSASDASGNKVTLGTANLTVGNSGVTSFDGIISGTGGVIKQGGGMSILTGVNTYTGATTVNNGSLAVNGSVVSAATAGAAGAVRGTGTISTQTAGVVWPGLALGGGLLAANETLTATKFAPAAGSKLKIAVNNSFQQKFVVNGQVAAMDLSVATLSLGITNGTAKTYVVLDATNGTNDLITKAFGTVTVNGAAPPVGVTVTYQNHLNANVTPAVATPANRVSVTVSGAVTPVTIDSFSVSAQGAGALLEWNCVSEFQNAGFNVYRRAVNGSEWSKINPALIAGRVTSPDARIYRLYDWAVPGQYEYKLDSISVQGDVETYHQIAGPIDVGGDRATGALTSEGVAAAIASVDADVNATVTQESSGKFAATDDARAIQINTKNTGNAVGLAFKADGTLVRPATVRVIDVAGNAEAAKVHSSDVATRSVGASSGRNPMVAARWFSSSSANTSTTFTAAKVLYDKSGVLLIPQASLPAGMNINHLAVQREGRTIPALAVTPDGLLVYGQGYQDDYTANDALFLRSTSGLTAAGQAAHAQGLFASEQIANIDSPASVTVDYHDVYFDYDNAFRPYTYAPWFSSQYLSADSATGTTQSFALNTPYASGSAAALTVNVWSLTQSETAPEDHALQVLVNGHPAGQAVWGGGNRMLQLTFQVPSGALKAGENQIDLVTPPIAGVDSQIAFLHSIKATYTRQLDGSKPVSVYNSSASTQLYELNNVPSANVWVVDVRFPDRASLVAYDVQDQGNGTYKVRFNASGGGTGQYQVVPAGMENAPLSVTRRQVKPLKLTGVYLATGPSQFNAGIQPLLMQRAKEGLRGQFVDQEQLFDYYNYGRYGPKGIQNSVRATRPQYLLLLGRTTYDYKNYSGLNVDPLCPAFLVSTTFWAQATSDSMFGDLGRGYSEVAVGRLPVNNATELGVAVKHVLSNSGAPATGVRIHAVADQSDPTVANFPAQADTLSQSFPDTAWQPNYLGVTYQTPPEVTSALTTAANGGADWIIYIGHGNAVGLGNATPKILDTTSVQSWAGNVVLLQSTCTANWMAKNVNDYKSIAIQALTQPQGGIAASIGTSTYMNSDCAVPFLAQLIKNADTGGAGPGSRMRWGVALMKAQQWAASQGPGFYSDLGNTEQLFGDPAMPVFSKSPVTGQPPVGGTPTTGPVDSATPATGTF